MHWPLVEMLPQPLLEAGARGRFILQLVGSVIREKPHQSLEVDSGWTRYFSEQIPRRKASLPRVNLRPCYTEH